MQNEGVTKEHFDRILGLVLERLDREDEILQEHSRYHREHFKRFDAIDETLRVMSRAQDSDSVTIIKHGKRIKKLERAVFAT